MNAHGGMALLIYQSVPHIPFLLITELQAAAVTIFILQDLE